MMRNHLALRRRVAGAIALTAVAGAAVPSPRAETPCTGAGLPLSALTVKTFRPTATEERAVGPEEMRRLATDSDPPDRSDRAGRVPLSLTLKDFEIRYAVDHRPVKGAGDTFCDAPSRVEIGLGYTARIVYLVREAAADPCVRTALLDHEARRATTEADALDEFVRSAGPVLRAALAELKRTPARTPEGATAGFEVRLRSLLAETAARFREERAPERARRSARPRTRGGSTPRATGV